MWRSNMIQGIGLDIVETSRIERLLERYHHQFIKLILTEKETAIFSHIKNQQRRVEWLAGRFSAKEAISKAIGTGIQKRLTLKDIEVIPMENGQPRAFIYGKYHEKIHLSITHTKALAATYCILERE